MPVSQLTHINKRDGKRALISTTHVGLWESSYAENPLFWGRLSLSLSFSFPSPPLSLSIWLMLDPVCFSNVQNPTSSCLSVSLSLSLSLSLHPVSGGVESWLCLIAEWQDLRERSGAAASVNALRAPTPGERRGRCRKEVFGVWERVSWGIFTQWGGEERGKTLK